MITINEADEIINEFLENKDNTNTLVTIQQNEWLRVCGGNKEFLIKDTYPRYKELYENATGFNMPAKLEGAEGSQMYEINLANFPREWTVEQVLNNLKNFSYEK